MSLLGGEPEDSVAPAAGGAALREARRPGGGGEELEQEMEDSGDEGGDLLGSLLGTAARSQGFFRHQQVLRTGGQVTVAAQVGEAELSGEERGRIVKELLASRPAVFLQRFGSFLR
jgi:hypothetical protein